MRLRVALSCVVLVTLSSGCSRTLPFNFSFSSSADGGTAGADLAGSLDMSISLDLGVPDLRVSDQGDDQAMSLDDLAPLDMVKQIDQASDSGSITDLAIDLRVVSDLRTSHLNTTDLANFDQAKVRSPIGGPCVTGEQCLSGLTCMTQIPVGTSVIDVPGGYCTKECTGVDALECTDAAKCYDFGDKSFCVRGCDTLCPIARNIGTNNYGCCSYQDPSGPIDPLPVLVGCLPLGIAGQSGYSCLAVGP